MTRRPFGEDINVWGVFWVAMAAVLAISAGWAAPRAVHLIPWRAEKRLGRLLDTTSLGPACDVSHEPAWEDLTALVARLYPQKSSELEAPITVHLVRSHQVNAFAALGGEVFILTGLLDTIASPDALAGVLAHELEHVSRRHLMRHLVDSAALSTVLLALVGDDSAASSMAKSADYWSGLHFTRAQEAEADAGAVRRLRQAGIALAPLADFFASLAQQVQMPTWASDHPGLQDRVAALKAQVPYPSAPAMPWSRWQALKALCQDAPHKD